jgi:hypothetical protein
VGCGENLIDGVYLGVSFHLMCRGIHYGGRHPKMGSKKAEVGYLNYYMIQIHDRQSWCKKKDTRLSPISAPRIFERQYAMPCNMPQKTTLFVLAPAFSSINGDYPPLLDVTQRLI